ncbi:MAG: ribonuclease E/G, partial [Acidobacteria bacterium]|nr:ribonuclease E/G [Acidobacteriota bacterium]
LEESGLNPGDLLLARVDKIQPAMGAAFLQCGEHSLMLRREQTYLWRDKLLVGDAAFSLLKVGQSHWVQVIRVAEGRKNPLVTTQIKWKDWGLIWVWPGERTSFSKKWQGPHQSPLSLDPPAEVGVIWRSAAQSQSPDALKQAWLRLEAQWQAVREVAQHRKTDLVKPVNPVTEWLLENGSDLDQVIVEGDALAETLTHFWQSATHRPLVKVHQGPGLLRDVYKLESAFSSFLQSKIWLPSGGYLEIKPGQALTVFDVNSGKGSGGRKPGLALKTNLEAALEVARQILLRDIGGLIVIDFIDLKSAEDRHKVEQQFQAALSFDTAKRQIQPISALGLLEMSRQKREMGFLHQHAVDCPVCKGSGQVRSLLSRAYALYDQALRRGVKDEPIILMVRPPLLHWFQNHGAKILEALHQLFPAGVEVKQAFADNPEGVEIGTRS